MDLVKRNNTDRRNDEREVVGEPTRKRDQKALDKQTESAFSNYPEITDKTIQNLKEKGITSLFPIQQHCFKHIYNGEDIIARDLTGSGKTLGFALPLVENLRSKRWLGSHKI